MLSKRLIPFACAAAITTATPTTPVHAQGGPLDSRTEFTFNQTVELPGVTLPPGTYTFRFVDATTGRKVMQVQAKDASNKTYGMFLTISAQRPQPSDEAELRFMETPAGQPAAVKTWWYPGNTIGREFIYPKSQARRLAQATNQSVLTTKAENVTGEEMKSADLSYVSASGEEREASDAELVDAAANTPPVGTSTVDTASTPDTMAARAPEQEGTLAVNAPRRTSLPRTSTALPIVGLLGLMSLAGGAAVRFRR